MECFFFSYEVINDKFDTITTLLDMFSIRHAIPSEWKALFC